MKRHVCIFVLGCVFTMLIVGCSFFDMFGTNKTTTTEEDDWNYPIPDNSNFRWRVVSSYLEFQGEEGKIITYSINGGSEIVYSAPFYVEDGDLIAGSYDGKAYAFPVYTSSSAVDITATISVSGESVRLAPSPKINEIDVTSISLSGPSGETIKYRLDGGAEVSKSIVSLTPPATGYKSHTLVVSAGDTSKIFLFKLYASSSAVTKIPCLLVDGGTDDWWQVGSSTRSYKLKGETTTTVVAYTTTGGDPTDPAAADRIVGTGEISFYLSQPTTLRVSAQTPGKSWSPIIAYEIQNVGSQPPEFWAYSGGAWIRVAGSTSLPYGTQIQVRGPYRAKGQIKLVLPGQAIPKPSEMDSVSEVDLPYVLTATSSAVIAARSRASGESWSTIVSLTLTVVGAPTTYDFAVSFNPAGQRPLYIKRLSTMSVTSSVAETIVDGEMRTSLSLKPGWYKIGAGSSSLGWLQDGIFRMTIGTITSPATIAGFQLDNEGHYQWFVSVKNDGTIVDSLVSL
ncbi:MAG: hypothetical protein KA799_01700 [Bacteroidales bacterium]|nr:hypothetical protein [Bacteroidales bacterium]HQL12076.1 hypothetical protein [bacterium]